MDIGAALLLLEIRRCRSGDVKRAVQMYIDNLLPFFQAHFEEETVAHNACVVDNAVHPSEMVHGRLNDTSRGAPFRHAVGIGRSLAPRTTNFFGHVLRTT